MPSQRDRWFLEYLTCFITGFVILVLELIAFRLLAPYFGMSNYVTGIIINIILLALAVGYILGGYIADRNSSTRLPALFIFSSTLYLIFVYALYSPLLKFLSKESLSFGASVAVILMFFFPVILLACILPYFVRMVAQNEEVGKATGRIYALSTMGSIFGGLTTTFLFIPFWGSRTTFSLAIILLSLISTLHFKRKIMGTLFLSLLPLPLLFMPNLTDNNHVYCGESEYNFITVSKRGTELFLHLNDGLGQHSKTLDPDTMLSNYYYDFFLFTQMLIEAEDTLVLGNGAGTSMIQTTHFFDTRIDGVELDPQLTALGRTYFDLQPSAKVKVIHEDARMFVNNSVKEYDIIYVDVYAGGPYVPFHVATLEFYEQIRELLSGQGVLAVNIPFFSLHSELGDYFLNTIGRVFPDSIYLSGSMVYAFNGEMTEEELERRLSDRKFSRVLRELGQRIVSGLRKVKISDDKRIFTDDLAPVEALTSRLLKAGLEKYAGSHSSDNKSEF